MKKTRNRRKIVISMGTQGVSVDNGDGNTCDKKKKTKAEMN